MNDTSIVGDTRISSEHMSRNIASNLLESKESVITVKLLSKNGK